ncbi:MAG: phage baseplate assembly protein V [Pseudomonadota bacterium]
MTGTLGRISRRLQLMIGRCVIRAIAADGGRVLVSIDGLQDESADALELAEPVWLTALPLDGAEGISLSVMGDGSHRVVLPLGDRRYRPTDLQPGESSRFDDLGHRIDIRRDGIRIVSPDQIEIDAPSMTVNGEAVATVTHLVQVGAGSSAGQWPIVTGVGDGG